MREVKILNFICCFFLFLGSIIGSFGINVNEPMCNGTERDSKKNPSPRWSETTGDEIFHPF